MNEIIQFERVDLATVEPSEPLADILEQSSQLLFVVRADDFARLSAP